MIKNRFISELKGVLDLLINLSRDHKNPNVDKANNEDEWFVLGWTMSPLTHLLEAIIILAEKDKHTEVAIISRSVMELMGLFTWTTWDKERAKKYRKRVVELEKDLDRVWKKIEEGKASSLSDIGQPRNDEAYRDLITQSGLSEKHIKILDVNYDELSLYVHPSPIVSRSFSRNDQKLCQYYSKMALFSIQMVIARAKDLKIVNLELADDTRGKIQNLVAEIAKSQKD
jgi:hypothetical protein